MNHLDTAFELLGYARIVLYDDLRNTKNIRYLINHKS